MQFQADIAGCAVDRPKIVESTARGAAMLAALGAGLVTMDDLKDLRVTNKRFEPKMDEDLRLERIRKWNLAIEAAKIII